MKEIPSKQDKVDLVQLADILKHKETCIVFYGQLQNLSERVDRVLTTYGVAFHIANMIIRGEQNLDGVVLHYTGLNVVHKSAYNIHAWPLNVGAGGRGSSVSDILGLIRVRRVATRLP